MMSMKKTKGFTLVELLIVITIISILAGVVMASLNTARSKSRDAKRIADISQLQLALALYLNATGHYPIGTGASNVPGTVLQDELSSKNYIVEIPTDPFTDHATYKYSYKSDSPGNTYCLSAVLENSSIYIDTVAADAYETCEGTNLGAGSHIYKVKK
jgi:prepilin-type N-terminal cleavage/methylation domain-containing protein